MAAEKRARISCGGQIEAEVSGDVFMIRQFWGDCSGKYREICCRSQTCESVDGRKSLFVFQNRSAGFVDLSGTLLHSEIPFYLWMRIRESRSSASSWEASPTGALSNIRQRRWKTFPFLLKRKSSAPIERPNGFSNTQNRPKTAACNVSSRAQAVPLTYREWRLP